MGRVIAGVAGGGRPWFIRVINTALLAILPIAVLTKNVDLLMMITVALASITLATIIVEWEPHTVAAFTEDELIIKRGREGILTIPRSVVTSSNILCIERGHRGFRLRVTYGSADYTIPLGKWVYNRLVSRLREHWGWVPPEC
ncbi:MAG: hypothetical protein RXR10_08365 [Vulcanisaeta sp.]